MIYHWIVRAADYAFSVYAAVVALFCNLLTWPLLLLVPGAMRRRRIARLGTLMVFWLSGIGVSVSGRENLPAGDCIVVANHRSYFDGLALIVGLPAGFSPLIKAAVWRIPVLGRVMHRAGSVFVRRTPTEAAAADTLKLIRRVRAGLSPAVFPEGTLSPDKGLLPFRDGAFVIAGLTGLPVVPVAISGTPTILPARGRRLRWGRAQVDIGEPLWPTGGHRHHAQSLRAAAELRLWRLLSPTTADWRSELPTVSYDRRCVGQQAPPVAIVDLDLLSEHARVVLRGIRSRRLRLDARAVMFPRLGLRLWRSDVRFAGVLVHDVRQAGEWLAHREFRDVLLAAETDDIDDAGLSELADMQRRTGQLSLCARDERALDRINAAMSAAGTTLSLCLRLQPVDIDNPSDTGARLDAFINACRQRANVNYRGIWLAEGPASTAGAATAPMTCALKALANHTHTVATRVVLPAPTLLVADLATHWTPDAVVGESLFTPVDGRSICRVVAIDQQTGEMPDSRPGATPAALADAGYPVLGVYGGCIVARLNTPLPAQPS